MTTIHGASVHQGQARPVKEALAFGALAGRETLPILGVQRLVRDVRDIGQHVAGCRLHTHDFGAWDGQRVGAGLLFQEPAQVGAVAVDGIGDHPAHGQTRRLGALDHPLRQFGFGGKGDVGGDVSGEPARQIVTPLFGQIQFAVDQRMAQRRDVGEEDAHLTVVDLSRRPAILLPDADRVAAAFGKAAFINDEDREGWLVHSGGGRGQGLADQGAQFITHAGLVPDGTREQALHAVGPQLPSVFGDLPAIFAGDLAEDGLQVEQSVLAGFGASEAGRDLLVQMAQGQGPAAHLLEEGGNVCVCGKLKGSQAVSPF